MIHFPEQRKSAPMKAVPLFELSWREYAKGASGTYGVIRSQTHMIRVEREAAMSLFGALNDAHDFYDVKVERSSWRSYVSSTEATA